MIQRQPMSDYVSPQEIDGVSFYLGTIQHVDHLDRAQSFVATRKCTKKLPVTEAIASAAEAVMLKMIHALSRNREAATHCINQDTNLYVHTIAGLRQLAAPVILTDYLFRVSMFLRDPDHHYPTIKVETRLWVVEHSSLGVKALKDGS
jgi:hypothetical protein